MGGIIRFWPAAIILLLSTTEGLAGQGRPVLHEAVFAVDGNPVAHVRHAELVRCVWIATYGIHGGELQGALAVAPSADSAVLRISFYTEPTNGPLSQLDGSDARLHTAVLVRDGPLLLSRKEPGHEGPYEWNAGLSDWSELLLALLRLPTRREDGAPSVREFSSAEVAGVRANWRDESVAEFESCIDLAQIAEITWRPQG